MQKTDWNDVLVREGIDSVKRQLGLNSYEIKPKEIDMEPIKQTLVKNTISDLIYSNVGEISFDEHKKMSFVYDEMDSFDSSKSKAIELTQSDYLSKVDGYGLIENPSVPSNNIRSESSKNNVKVLVKEIEI